MRVHQYLSCGRDWIRARCAGSISIAIESSREGTLAHRALLLEKLEDFRVSRARRSERERERDFTGSCPARERFIAIVSARFSSPVSLITADLRSLTLRSQRETIMAGRGNEYIRSITLDFTVRRVSISIPGRPLYRVLLASTRARTKDAFAARGCCSSKPDAAVRLREREG